jgi:hypothetical protein
MGLQWAVSEASVQTDRLNHLQTDIRSWMGNRITPSNSSELVSLWSQPLVNSDIEL